MIDIHSSRVLLQCKDRLSSLFADTLKGIMYEILYIAGDKDRKERFNEHVISFILHGRSYLSKGVIELRD